MDVLMPPRPDSLDDCPLPEYMQTPNIEDAQANNVVAPALPSSRKKALIPLAAALVIVGAVVGVIVSTSYSLNPSKETATNSLINQHFKTIRQRFTGVRTYQTRGYRNAIDAAADAGLKIYAGVWIRTDENSINADMQAVVEGVRRHPWNVKGVFVGNEELSNGIDQWTVLGRVRQMKQKLIDAGYGWIPVGSVQVDGDWFRAPDLAAGCDLIGANIHPFFSAGPDSTWNPLGDLDVRWKNIYAKFGAKAVVTETGWPTAGGQFNGHWPSMDMTKSYYTQFQNWARTNGGDMPAFFVFHDNTNKSPDYEVSFGLAWSNGYWKFDANTDIKGIAFVNPANDRVLAMTDNRQVEFHSRWGNIGESNRWGNDWIWDWNSLWILRGPLVVMWEANTKTDVCLDAYEPWNGGTVHLYPCDASIGNQQWTYDSSSKQLRHAAHVGFCLDLNSPNVSTPYLWTCHYVNDPNYPLQKLDVLACYQESYHVLLPS
ncbi:hypothetical protein AC1031_006488 [Aphanomyces cochlioides]|nr:hypothetical protein AC1031_006488 [Aphanomyces cochlioides]